MFSSWYDMIFKRILYDLIWLDMIVGPYEIHLIFSQILF